MVFGAIGFGGFRVLKWLKGSKKHPDYIKTLDWALNDTNCA